MVALCSVFGAKFRFRRCRQQKCLPPLFCAARSWACIMVSMPVGAAPVVSANHPADSSKLIDRLKVHIKKQKANNYNAKSNRSDSISLTLSLPFMYQRDTSLLVIKLTFLISDKKDNCLFTTKQHPPPRGGFLPGSAPDPSVPSLPRAHDSEPRSF